MDLEKNVELRSFSEVDLRCPLCHHIFINPVLLSCSHNVCEYCVRRFWEDKACKVCPVCQRRISMDFPPVNLALRNWCETFTQEKRQKSSSGICSAHKEKLKLFCLDDQEPVCLVCRDSKLHTNHRFSPVDEAVIDNKETLKTALKPLQEILRKFENVKQSMDQTSQDIKIKAQQTETQIKAEFEELHRLLRDEEAIRVTALREEEKQRSQMMKQKIDETSRQISSLSSTIRDVEEQMEDDDVSFLQNFKSTLQRTQCQLLNPEKNSVMIDFSNHLGNLKLNVLTKLQKKFDKKEGLYLPLGLRGTYVKQKCVTAFGVKNPENSMRQQHQSKTIYKTDYSDMSSDHRSHHIQPQTVKKGNSMITNNKNTTPYKR
uniref:Uncharacterized protein n=1 Tax=Cyprinus carpio carpio TaxID=630221 RepID=A0A9J8C6N8_CYPCA